MHTVSMDAYFSASDLAHLYRVRPGTIRSWASRDGLSLASVMGSGANSVISHGW